MWGPHTQSINLRNLFFAFFFLLSYYDYNFFKSYNNVNNNGSDNRAPPCLVVKYKIKIIERDKNIVFGLGRALFPNIIPKKSSSLPLPWPLDPPLPPSVMVPSSGLVTRLLSSLHHHNRVETTG